jgi:hypothetical protein
MQTATIRAQRNSGSAAQKPEQPRRLSKIGQWRRDNPGGIIRVLDRRAVNK